MKLTRILIFVLALSVLPMSGCRKWIVRHKQRKELRALKQKQREKDREKMQKYRDAVEHQASIQDKKTRKAMKKQYKKSRRYHSHKKEFFLKRWFKGGKRNKNIPQKKGGA